MATCSLVFLWENLGPTHVDRLQAVAAQAGPGRPVVAIQYAARSHTYGWAGADPSGFALHTLFPASPRKGWRLAVRLARACLRQGRADFFLCHYEEWPVWLTAILLRLAGRRVFAMMESKFDDYPRRLWREVLKALFLRPYQGALTASERSRDYLRFLGLPAARLALGYSSLSVNRIERLAEALPAPEGVPFADRDFVVVARLVPKKNIALAIEAFAQWRGETGGRRLLHLCGSGPLEPALREQARVLGVADAVRFHGFVQSDAVSRRLAGALCLILPSTEEQFGLVVIEALALGVPVLVTPRAGAADRLVIPGVNGFLLDAARPESGAALMTLLSENEALWRRLATAARNSREGGDCHHFAAAVETLVGGKPIERASDRLIPRAAAFP